MKTIALIAACCILLMADASMLGITVGSPEAALKKLKLEEVAREPGMVKYRTANGNDFSVTTENGKVVFMENDWSQDPAGKEALLPGFSFGETSLADIRKRFGCNGFTHKEFRYMQTETDVILFNCFEIDSATPEVLVCITKVPMDGDVNESNLAEKAKLEALIVASPVYLDGLWGSEKAYDPDNKKIRL